MKMYDILIANQNKCFRFKKTEEYKYFKARKKVLRTARSIAKKIHVDSTFDLICANIFVTTLINKQKLDVICKDSITSIYLKDKFTEEEFLKYYHARIIDLKSFNSNNTRIFVPFFSHLINNIYFNEPYKLLNEPYNAIFDSFVGNIIDPFECYNYELFDSLFTKLVKIKKYNDSTVFYHFDTATIFMINNQGRLDFVVPLFDKKLKAIKTSHVCEKIEKCTDKFFLNDREGFVNEMCIQELISKEMCARLLKSK